MQNKEEYIEVNNIDNVLRLKKRKFILNNRNTPNTLYVDYNTYGIMIESLKWSDSDNSSIFLSVYKECNICVLNVEITVCYFEYVNNNNNNLYVKYKNK